MEKSTKRSLRGLLESLSSVSKGESSSKVATLRSYRYIIFSLIFWLIFTTYINLVPPISLVSRFGFFVVAFLCLFTTSFSFLRKFKVSLILASYLVSLLLLFYFKLGGILNIFLLTAFFVAFFFLLRK